MNRNYTLIGLFSFLLGFLLAFPIGGLLWLAMYRDQKFGADFILFRVYSLQSMVILTFFLIFLGSAAYFYFRGLPSASSVLNRLKGVSLAPKSSPKTSKPPENTPPTLGA